MNRNPGKLAEREYDLVIIGAGIYGVCAAWDATLRGLSVAIVDRGDFCGCTSANPLATGRGPTSWKSIRRSRAVKSTLPSANGVTSATIDPRKRMMINPHFPMRFFRLYTNTRMD